MLQLVFKGRCCLGNCSAADICYDRMRGNSNSATSTISEELEMKTSAFLCQVGDNVVDTEALFKSKAQVFLHLLKIVT